MKTLKFTLSIFVIAFFICINKVDGQTVQVYPNVTVDGVAWCLNRPVYGYITYHLTYHLDRKTGFVDRMHANVHKAELWDSKTGEKYIYIDTGNDNLGVSWGFWNNPDNPGFDYDLPENSIPVGTLPTEGCNVWATFKLITKGGEKYTMRSVTQVHINANGETTAEFYKSSEDCNY
jgi:hypothetical protein